MDRTLFTPPMIETFKVCRRAYQMAFLRKESFERTKLSTLCKRFLLKALAEINRGKIENLPQVQKFLGQHWPSEKLSAEADADMQEKFVEAFRFVYRVLTNYVVRPYRPEGAEIAGVALKVRCRIPHTKVYLEDTFDLILWHPKTKHLEFVDYHLHPLKRFDPAWPTASILVKQFLAERLRSRWPFETLSISFCQLLPNSTVVNNLSLDDSVYRLHWPEMLKTVEGMKDPLDYAPHRNELCRRCEFLAECLSMGQQEEGQVRESAYRTA